LTLSLHEASFVTLLDRRKIPWLSDGLVYCEYDQFWAHQLDLFTLPDMKSPGQPALAIDWELDHEEHEEPSLKKKDASRDERLMDTDEWWFRRPVVEGYMVRPPRGSRRGWVIFRLPYRILDRCVNLKTKNLKRKNMDILTRVDELISEAWVADRPKKVIWED
jgi:hypothetical protein